MDIGQWIASNLTAAAAGGILGALLAPFPKAFAERWIPALAGWYQQQAQARQRVLAMYRDPMLRAADDFQSRLFNIISPAQDGKTCKPYSEGGEAYMRAYGGHEYFVESTLFEAAQYFAWSEILKQRIRLLNYRDLSTRLDVVEERIAATRSKFQVFRLHQREIGERMIVNDDTRDETRVLTCKEFLDQIREQPQSPLARSLKPLQSAIDRIPRDPETRAELTFIQHALIDLIKLIDDRRNPWIRPELSLKACAGTTCVEACCRRTLAVAAISD
jgi:hypothetical protein